MTFYEINWERCSDGEGHVPAGTLEITQDPTNLGPFQLWSYSLHCWEIKAFHKECKKILRNNNSKLPDGTEVSALEAWSLAQPMKKIKDITKEDIRHWGPLSFRVRLVDDKRYTEEEVDGMTNEELSKLSPVCKNLAYSEWYHDSSDDDTEAEYYWWLDAYGKQLNQLVAMDELTESEAAKRWPDGKGYLIPNINERKEPIPTQITKIQGCGTAMWQFSSEIGKLNEMSQPPSREEWIESVAILHNSIIEKLEPNWQKASQFYF